MAKKKPVAVFAREDGSFVTKLSLKSYETVDNVRKTLAQYGINDPWEVNLYFEEGLKPKEIESAPKYVPSSKPKKISEPSSSKPAPQTTTSPAQAKPTTPHSTSTKPGPGPLCFKREDAVIATFVWP